MDEKRINRNLKLLKKVLIILIIVLITKLLWVCVYYYQGYKLLSDNQITIETSQQHPRGKILDTNGQVLAQDQGKNVLKYIESSQMDEEQKEELAAKIASLITIEDPSVNDVDLKDFVLSKNDNLLKVINSLSEQERKDAANLSENDYNNLLRERVTEEMQNEVTANYTPQQLYIILKMNQSTSKKSVLIKENISDEEYYNIAQIANACGGFYLDVEYDRIYPQGDVLRSFLGNYGEIPQEELDSYISLGYSQSDKVGRSYLELELEPTIRSISSTVSYVFDDKGNIINQEISSPGRRGNDVYLTIDLDIQKLVEQQLTAALEANTYELNKNAYASIVNPDNGDLIALGGKQKTENNQIIDNSIGNYVSAYTLGSTIKPAILSLGYSSGTWQKNRVVEDTPWYIQGTPEKASHTNMGIIGEQEAIARSSNIYFYSVLLAYAGVSYVPNAGLSVDSQKFDGVRTYLQSYGLGASTGIDSRNELTGVKGESDVAGLYLDLANGQYDTYTNLQQAQYAATIENLGTRYKINYIDKIVQPAVDTKENQLVYESTPVVLNEVDINQEQAEYIRSLMDNAKDYPRSTLASKGFNLTRRLSAKTGTSESFYYDSKTHQLTQTNTTTFIGTYEGKKSKYTIAITIPDYTDPGNQTRTESGHVAAQILNQMEKNNA